MDLPTLLALLIVAAVALWISQPAYRRQSLTQELKPYAFVFVFAAGVLVISSVVFNSPQIPEAQKPFVCIGVILVWIFIYQQLRERWF